ncbi:MAG TPA: L,D-transpeptidase [Rhizomicrobium sp.]|nr:L,D-transpeptidase [Rhizomicrobium sp.]
MRSSASLRRIAVFVPLLLAALPALGQGAKTSSVADADIDTLRPGEFIWAPQLAPEGPTTVVVSLPAQRAYVYRNGVRIGASTISTGKKGHETPTGVFTILQKREEHYSNRYNNAPMPYMQRLTWDGIALHAGKLPGYAASHGCVRLPLAFSKALFKETSLGMTVVVTDDARPSPQTVLDPGLAAAPGTDPHLRLNAGEEFRWHPEKSPSGPVTILVSFADQRMLVLRNGKVIGRARVEVPPGLFNGTEALQMEGRDANGRPRWLYIGIPGREASHGKPLDRNTIEQVRVPEKFLASLHGILAPGATMMVTNDSFAASNEGRPAKVLSS